MDDDSPLLDNHDIIEPLNERNDPKSIESLREWFIWSYLNVIFGLVILGVIAIGCSLRTNKFKGRQNYEKARKWSYTTLIVNCIATLSGLTIFAYLIYLMSHSILIEQKQMIGKNNIVGLIHPK
ncbi:unnamed protein product [Rotaria sordida]|uniref:Interferon-induced transmembrane protein n=1 Tax=Rotaria sordida TaxID=392033 RepID=A0A813Y7R5_9BILA|nr:unnamed protein product [Rotaria sordida]CAF0900962.1 unnamed protein product [Rotaria sordida]CAF4162522.1 unnamed protein product [Rotaria sordida]CAF4168159.1 unnamed protein product [Rotaria sordida]